ncbi:MAG: VanW family protein [Clostridia bacterium]|nr:VanW family protein [Clostridia bacterium]
MKQHTDAEQDRIFFHIITLVICLAILLLTSILLLVRYWFQTKEQSKTQALFESYQARSEDYFSGRILRGVTVSGYDVGGMTREEAQELLASCVDYHIPVNKLVLTYQDHTWELDRETFRLSVDVASAVEKALNVGRKGTEQERRDALARLERGETIDVSAVVISDSAPLIERLKEIKAEVDVPRRNATVSFSYNGGHPLYTYTDEQVGVSLDINQAYRDIAVLAGKDEEILTYAFTPTVIEPTTRRADLERDYTLVSSFSTWLSTSSAAGRVNNIRTALECLDEHVWLPGETFSFNQWVGERTTEKGFGMGVFINEQQQYDETVGGGICQVSTTIFNAALLCGANLPGRHAPIEITERRTHTWPSEYIDRGLDATVSWPSTDLKLYNNSPTPYFLHTEMNRSGNRYYVVVQIYGMKLANNASVRIETETVSEVPYAQETILDVDNLYNLAPGEEKVVVRGRTGYTVNVIQVWSEPGKEDVKSLITVSRYSPINAKVYVSAQQSADPAQNLTG